MTDQFVNTNKMVPITPPPELVEQWVQNTRSHDSIGAFPEDFNNQIATQAARWGADQELEACCEFLDDNELCDPNFHKDLRAARRPKPPSLKEQALKMLDDVERFTEGDFYTIRRALEQLDD